MIPPIVKSGAGRGLVQLAEPFAGDLRANGGTVAFSGRVCTYEWYRWKLTGQAQANYNIAVGDLLLYPAANKSENLCSGIVAGNGVYIDGRASGNASTLEAGKAVASFTIQTSGTFPTGFNGGTLENFTAAETGTLYLVNADDLRAFIDAPVPLTLNGVNALGNLHNWTLVVDEVENKRWTLRVADGKVYLDPPGMVLIVR